jgi:bacterioferritin-associated ferredoxin
METDMEPDERLMARLKAGCLCKGVKLIRLIEAIEAGAATFEQVAALTGIGDGPCKGKRCGEKVEELLTRFSAGQQNREQIL